MKKLFIIPALAIAISFASCGGNNSSTGSNDQAATEEVVESTTDEVVPGLSDVTISNAWVVEGNDQMKFDTELIRVQAGQDVQLTFKNVGTMPKESMGHNFVILQPGVDLAEFGGEAASAVDTDYIPASLVSSVIAHTKLLGPGEEDVITFQLEPGVYDYICSFPGHYGIMKGQIVAE